MSLGSANAALKSIQLPIFFDSLFRPYSGSSVQCRSDFRGSLFFNSKTNSMVTWFRLDSYSTFRSLVSSGRVNEVSIKTALVVAWDRIPLPSWLPFFLGGGHFDLWPKIMHHDSVSNFQDSPTVVTRLLTSAVSFFFSNFANASGDDFCLCHWIDRVRIPVPFFGNDPVAIVVLDFLCCSFGVGWRSASRFLTVFPISVLENKKKTKQNNNAIARSSHQHGSRWHRRPLDVLLRFLGFFFSYIFFRTRSAPIPSLIGQVGMTAMKRSQTANSPFVFGP